MRQDQFIPQLIVNDGAAAMDFYKRVFDAKEVSQGGTCKSPRTLGGTGVRITIYVDDADKAFERATAAGAKALMPVQDMFWGGRYGKLVDPFGHEWGINQQKRVQTEAETQKAADEYFTTRR